MLSDGAALPRSLRAEPAVIVQIGSQRIVLFWRVADALDYLLTLA